MLATIRRWGNSLGLRIPKHVAQDLMLDDGAAVNLEVEGDRLVITPVKRMTYQLEGLVASIKPSNVHDEVDVGSPEGREVW